MDGGPDETTRVMPEEKCQRLRVLLKNSDSKSGTKGGRSKRKDQNVEGADETMGGRKEASPLEGKKDRGLKPQPEKRRHGKSKTVHTPERYEAKRERVVNISQDEPEAG